MTQIKSTKMEKHQWINPDQHSIAVDDQKRPVLSESGELIVLDNESGKCMAVPQSDDVLEIFGFPAMGYTTEYASPSGSPKDSPEREMKPIVTVVTEADQLLWSMRTPCQKDIEATREMLALVASKKFQDMFNDQCTVKIRVWKRICEELMSKGYRIADSINEGGIKCHQKWRNLEKSYRNYLISSTDPNSSAPKKPPPYFEALHEILKKKKKYANAATYTHAQTVIVSEDMIDPDTSISSGMGLTGGGPPQNHLNDSDPLEELDDADGQNDDHCYVVNSSGHVSKRLKMDPLTVCSTTDGVSGGGMSYSRKQLQQPDVLEQILEKMVRVHRDTIAMQERHFVRMEKLMKDYAVQTRRLADVMNQFLHNSRADDCNKNNKSISMNLLDAE